MINLPDFIQPHILRTKNHIIQSFGQIKSSLRIILPIIWLSSSVLTSIFVITLIILTIGNPARLDNIKYSLYLAQPHVLGDSTNNVYAADSRAATLDKVFERYNCPITGYGPKFVEEADKNNIPYWLVASIAFQESTCGKFAPTKDGELTYNYYGWGVWGTNVKQFKNTEEGIEVVSKYMNDRFYARGVTDLCDIMKIYTPPSKGSWCEGVGFFRDQIINFKTP
jgi:hypothetical protein